VKFHCLDIRATPWFEATCPKGHGRMVELDNGWFSVCWYCPTCEFPYELQMRKMPNVQWENLAKQLDEKGIPHGGRQ
jgi:hypothetical protein